MKRKNFYLWNVLSLPWYYRTRSCFIYYYYEMKGILNLYPFIVVYFSCFYEVQIRISKEEEVIFENKFFQGNKKIINLFLHKSTWSFNTSFFTLLLLYLLNSIEKESSPLKIEEKMKRKCIKTFFCCYLLMMMYKNILLEISNAFLCVSTDDNLY